MLSQAKSEPTLAEMSFLFHITHRFVHHRQASPELVPLSPCILPPALTPLQELRKY